MKKILLTKGKFALVDDEDFEYLSQWSWCLDSTGYAVRAKFIKYLGKRKCKTKKIYMHRYINKTSMGLETDHINRNRLDNRKCNLRSVTKSQNRLNRTVRKDSGTGIKGISFIKKINKYRSLITINKECKHLGYFINIKDAIFARKQAEKVYHEI